MSAKTPIASITVTMCIGTKKMAMIKAGIAATSTAVARFNLDSDAIDKHTSESYREAERLAKALSSRYERTRRRSRRISCS